MAQIDLDSGKISLTSQEEYQKIFMEGDEAISIPSDEYRVITTIDHDLGYLPFVRVWATNDNGDIGECYPNTGMSFFSQWSNIGCYYFITPTQLIIYYDKFTLGSAESGHIYWRIYLDAA